MIYLKTFEEYNPEMRVLFGIMVLILKILMILNMVYISHRMKNMLNNMVMLTAMLYAN